MNIREIINKEKWDRGLFAFTHNESLDKILSAVLEDEAALMKQVKLWSTACKEAEQRIAELEADKAQLVDAAKAKDDMLVCYRLGKQPSEKLFARLEKANLTIAKHRGEA